MQQKAMKTAVQVLLAVICLPLLIGCASFSRDGAGGNGGARARLTPPSIRTVPVTVKRANLLNSLQQEVLIDRARIVEVYQSRSDDSLPLYRIFDVHPKSVYGVLGLKSGDILVAANQRTLANNQVFKQYVRLLRNEKSAEIEVIRGAEPLLFQYQFVE